MGICVVKECEIAAHISSTFMNPDQSKDNDFRLHTPLHCWDLFLETYHLKMDLAEDRAALQKLSELKNWKHSFDFEHELFRLNHTIIVTDPSIQIVFASSNMQVMNGYQPREVLGRNPSMFQGVASSTETKQYIREAIRKQVPFEATIANYRKNREIYDCMIRGFPVFDKSKSLVNFIAFESDPSA